MKLKPFIVVVLVVAVLAAVVFSHYRFAKSVVLPPTAIAKTVPAQTAMKPVLINPVKMVTVGGFVKKQPVLLPVQHVWSDVELIADAQADYMKRREAIGRLPTKLTEADWRILQKFLLTPDSSDSGQLGQVIKNELMDRLCAMQPPPSDLGKTLAGMCGNLLQNEVIRDYSVQHLATLNQALAQNGSKGIEQEEKANQKALWNALNETGDSIAGTALLGLARLSEQESTGVDQGKVASMALQMATDSSAGELTQITAYQVCAQMNVQDALPTIESAAQNSQSLSAQISAIGALGLLGGSSDIPLLQKLSKDKRLEFPAQTALQKIQSRITQSSSS